MKYNIKLKIAYEGTHYLGWQKTPAGPSIEGSLHHVLTQILQEPLLLQAASRTDAGVHALGQVVNFHTQKRLELDKFILSVNSLLPNSIVVLEAAYESFDFHPTLDGKEKEYHYFICHGKTQLPQHRHFSWHVPYVLDRKAMIEGTAFFIGEHDFSAFCNCKKNIHYKDLVRQLYALTIVELTPQRLCISIRGNHFLYKMVRNIVGTLVWVGRKKIEPQHVKTIIESKDRRMAGVTAPAHGLFLNHILY